MSESANKPEENDGTEPGDDGNPKKKNKERVIHTRVDESLDQELRDRAAGLGVTVSKLVRNVLQNTFGLVEGIMADSAHVARAASRKRAQEAEPEPAPASTAPPKDPPRVMGWQELILNLNALCSKCNAILPRGSRAAVAVMEVPTPPPHQVLCPQCLQELQSHDDNSNNV